MPHIQELCWEIKTLSTDNKLNPVTFNLTWDFNHFSD